MNNEIIMSNYVNTHIQTDTRIRTPKHTHIHIKHKRTDMGAIFLGPKPSIQDGTI